MQPVVPQGMPQPFHIIHVQLDALACTAVQVATLSAPGKLLCVNWSAHVEVAVFGFVVGGHAGQLRTAEASVPAQPPPLSPAEAEQATRTAADAPEPDPPDGALCQNVSSPVFVCPLC